MDVKELKQELLKVELSIKAIAGNYIEDMAYRWRNDEKRDKVKSLLQKCQISLNQMFTAAGTAIERFKQVNKMHYLKTD